MTDISEDMCIAFYEATEVTREGSIRNLDDGLLVVARLIAKQETERCAAILDTEAAEHEEVSEDDEWHLKQGRMLRRLAAVIRSGIE